MRPNILRSRFSAVAQDEEVAQQSESITTTRTASPAPAQASDAHSLPSQTRWHRPPSPEQPSSNRSSQHPGSDDGTSQHRLSAKERFRSQVQQVLQQDSPPSGSGYSAVPTSHQRQGSRSEETLVSDEYEPVKSYDYAGANISDFLGHYGGYYGGSSGFIIPMEEEDPKITPGKDETTVSVKNVAFDVSPASRAGFNIDPYSVSEHGYKGAEGYVEEQIPKSRPNYKPWTLKLWYPLAFVAFLLAFIGLTEYAARTLPDGIASSANAFYQPVEKSPANQTELHRIARSLGLRMGKYGHWEVDPVKRAEATGDGPNAPVGTPESNGNGSGNSGTSGTVNNAVNAVVGQSGAPNANPGTGSSGQGNTGNSPGNAPGSQGGQSTTPPPASPASSPPVSSPPPAAGNSNGNGHGNGAGNGGNGDDDNNSPPPVATPPKPTTPPPAPSSSTRPPTGDPSTNTPPANTPPVNIPPVNVPPVSIPPVNIPPVNGNPGIGNPPVHNDPPTQGEPTKTTEQPPESSSQSPTQPTGAPPTPTSTGPPKPPTGSPGNQPGAPGGPPPVPGPTTTEAPTTTKPGGGPLISFSVSLPIGIPIGVPGNGNNPPGPGDGGTEGQPGPTTTKTTERPTTTKPPGNTDPGPGGPGGQPEPPTTATTEQTTTAKPPLGGITVLPPVSFPFPVTVSIPPLFPGPGPGNGGPGNGGPGNGGPGNGGPGNGGPGNGGPGNSGPGNGNGNGNGNGDPAHPPGGIPGGGGIPSTLLPTDILPTDLTILDPWTPTIPTQFPPGPTGPPNPPGPPNGPGFPGGPAITPTKPADPPPGPTQQPPANTDDGGGFPIFPLPLPSFSISLPFQQPPQGQNPGNGGQTGGLPIQIPTNVPTVPNNGPPSNLPSNPPAFPPAGAIVQTPGPNPSDSPVQQPPAQQPPATNNPPSNPAPGTIPLPSPVATITRTAPSTPEPAIPNNPSIGGNDPSPTTRQSIDLGDNLAAATAFGSLGSFTLTETDSLGVPTATRSLQVLAVAITMISTDSNGHGISTWTQDVLYQGSPSTMIDPSGNPTKTEMIYVIPTTITSSSNGVPVSTFVSSVTNTPVVTTLTNAQGDPTMTLTYYAPVTSISQILVAGPMNTSPPSPQKQAEANVSPGLSFLGMAVPTLLAVLLSVAARLFDHNARLYYPFHAMTQYAGAATTDSLCFPAIGMGGFLQGFKLVRNQQYLLAVTGTMVVFSAILTILSGGAVHIIYTGDSCSQNSLETPNCGTGLVIFPTLARVVIALLAFMALCALVAMFILWRWRTGVWNNPWYIVNMLGMSTNQDIRTLLKNLREKDGKITRAQSAAALGPGPFMLDYWQENASLKYGILIGTSSQETLSGQTSRKEGRTGEMIRRKYRLLPQGNTVPFSVLTIVGRFWFLLLLCLLFIGVLTYNIFGGAEIQAGTAVSNGQVFLSYLFVAAGVLVSFLWSSTFHAVAFMSPYRVLGRSGSRGINSEDVLKMTPPTNIFSGMRSGFSRSRRDFFLGFVSIASFLSEFLPVLLLNLPKAMAGKSYLAQNAITYVTVAILVGMILLLGSSFPMHWPHLPIDPSTIVGSLYYASDPGVIALSPSSGFLLEGKKSLNAQ